MTGGADTVGDFLKGLLEATSDHALGWNTESGDRLTADLREGYAVELTRERVSPGAADFGVSLLFRGEAVKRIGRLDVSGVEGSATYHLLKGLWVSAAADAKDATGHLRIATRILAEKGTDEAETTAT